MYKLSSLIPLLMRYAISYISTANDDLSREEILTLFNQTIDFNNRHSITGLLIYSDGNFFQFIEGEKDKITALYSRIERDCRHKNLIKFIEKPVSKHANPGYICEFKTINSEYNESKKSEFLSYFQVLDPSARKAVERVIETIFL